MAISRVKTWSAGEVLTASDLNAECNNILNNAADLVSPFTKAISMGGFALNFDASNTIALTGTTNGISLTGGAFNTPQGADIASATGAGTLNLDTSTGNVVDVTGTTGISAVTLAQGRRRWVRFTGAIVLTHGASLVLPGAASITTAAGDYALFVGYSTSVVRVASFMRASGVPITGAVLLSTFTTKGDLVVATASGTVARQGVGSDGQAVASDSGQTNGIVYVDNPSRQNLLVNPNWQVDQINEGALYTLNTTNVRGPDGWSGTVVGAGVFKLRTLADPENAALKCLEITCTTADASIAAGDDYFIYTAIEGYDAAGLMAGTSAASAITVQFKFKTTLVGVYGISVANSAINRRYIGIITVADTSEHEYSVTLTMDTSGTWLYTNGVGVYLRICLSAGSNFQATAGAWGAGAEQTTSAQCNFMALNTHTAFLKRVQLIPGALVQAYRQADFRAELAKAQRYYAKTFPIGTAVAQAAGLTSALANRSQAAVPPNIFWQYPQRMGGTPTIVTYNPVTSTADWRDVTNGADRTVSVDPDTAVGDYGVLISSSSATNASDQSYIHASANRRLS